MEATRWTLVIEVSKWKGHMPRWAAEPVHRILCLLSGRGGGGWYLEKPYTTPFMS
jgi:hypothetical protein